MIEIVTKDQYSVSEDGIRALRVMFTRAIVRHLHCTALRFIYKKKNCETFL